MLQGPGKRGHIVADTLLPMLFLGLRKLGNNCCGHKMFLKKIRNTFCVPNAKFVFATNVARSGKRGNICVGDNVSSFASAFRLNFIIWKLVYWNKYHKLGYLLTEPLNSCDLRFQKCFLKFVTLPRMSKESKFILQFREF